MKRTSVDFSNFQRLQTIGPVYLEYKYMQSKANK